MFLPRAHNNSQAGMKYPQIDWGTDCDLGFGGAQDRNVFDGNAQQRQWGLEIAAAFVEATLNNGLGF
jgi:hypothetical protein